MLWKEAGFRSGQVVLGFAWSLHVEKPHPWIKENHYHKVLFLVGSVGETSQISTILLNHGNSCMVTFAYKT